eukprot:7382247-Prymnesium_polylepis.2
MHRGVARGSSVRRARAPRTLLTRVDAGATRVVVVATCRADSGCAGGASLETVVPFSAPTAALVAREAHRVSVSPGGARLRCRCSGQAR